MRVIDEPTAERLASLELAIEAIGAAFIALDAGRAAAFPVSFGHGLDPRTRFSMKAGRLDEGAVVGVKVGSYWPDNPRRGLASHGSTTLLLDNDTGHPRAIIAATRLNALRTAAADAVAVRALSDPAAAHVALVGAGHQAWFELQAVCAVRPIRSAAIWSRDGATARRLAHRARRELGLAAAGSSDLQAVLKNAPIVICVTAAREPLVMREWVAPGAHISAMGADGPGKQELDLDLVAAARLFADDPEQSVTLGEFEAAARAGLVGKGLVTPIGAVLRGRAPGRLAPGELTVFDSSGLAIQDLAIAAQVLARFEHELTP